MGFGGPPSATLFVDESLLDLGGVALPLAGSFNCSSSRFTTLSRCGFLLMDLAGFGGGLCLGVGGLDDAAVVLEPEVGGVSPTSPPPPLPPLLPGGLLVPTDVVSVSDGCKSALIAKFLTGLGGIFLASLS